MRAAAPGHRPIFSNAFCSTFARWTVCAVMLACLCAQHPNRVAAQAGQTPAQATQSDAQKPAPVTTTVVVHGELNSKYLPEAVTVGTIDGASLKEAPLSATVVTRDMMNDQVSRLLSDVVANDASVDDDYVPVGYYGDYEIRGYPIDLATGLEINGMTIAGEQDVPLENKQQVEVLNGVAGVESGVATGGGLIGYITKRPALVKDLDLATDHRGTIYGATDLGRFFGNSKQVGARVNLAGERIQSYLDGADAWRAVGAGAADWKLSSRAVLKGDFEYQHRTGRDGSGYQLLGGAILPDINRIYRSTMLGAQSWAPPDTFDTFNTGARLNFSLSPMWTAFVAGSISHSLIQDNVIYAYGTPFDANGDVACPNAPNALAYFFCPDGSYGIYDYRNPGELRIDAEGEAMMTGQIQTGAITQTITFGGQLFLRSVQEPGAQPLNAPDNIQDGAVYAYLGSENIYQSMQPYPIETDPVTGTAEQAGPRTLWEDNHQSSAVLQDRVHLPGRVQLIAGGRYDALRDHNYSAQATDPTAPMQPTDKPVWLPQFAATFNPARSLTLYSNYGVLLSLGPQGPWWANDDASQLLAPYSTRQVEVGAKYEPAQSILLSGDFFHMRSPFFYPKLLAVPDSLHSNCSFDSNAPANLCFVSEGHETHNGVELNAQGTAARWLRITASAAAINAKSESTGTPAFDNRQVINVPHLHTTVSADVTLPGLRGLHLLPGWSYTGRKEATRDDAVSVPAYNIFNFGARYTPGGEQGRITFRLYASNIANKRYWSDTGASYGDTFLWLGAPTTVRLSAHYTF
ncbi:MAG TPA: TonB-dependent siderophore receptor [Terracidiphilus sp.]|nr:TonB-dependent siderophore receptor [Terracidiphilus sp.]